MVWLRKLRKQSSGMRKFFLQFKPNKTEDSDDMAKRNKQKARESRSGTSPYVKYQKTPYRYSSDYYAWKTKVTGKASKVPL